MEENAMYDIGHEVDELDARSAAAIEALQHESANLREAAEMRAKTALDLKATSDAQVKVASTVNLINRSMSGAFRALAALRAKIVAYKQDTAQAADELLAEAAEIEASLKANQEETFEAVTQVLGAALSEISGEAPTKDGEAGEQDRGEALREAWTQETPVEQEKASGPEIDDIAEDEPPSAGPGRDDAHARAEDIARRVPPFNDLDEPDGVVAPGAGSVHGRDDGRLDALLAFMKESVEAINGRMSEIERAVSQPGESTQEIADDKGVQEQGDVGVEEAELGTSSAAEREAGLPDQPASSVVENEEKAEPDHDEVNPSPGEQHAVDENPSRPDNEEGPDRPTDGASVSAQEPGEKAGRVGSTAPTTVPGRLTRTSGFGADAQTRSERVKDVYSAAQVIKAAQDEPAFTTQDESAVEKQHRVGLAEALMNKHGYL